MLPTWFQGVMGAAKAPPFRYKQTSVTFTNSGSATYDANGYVSTLTTTNDRFGDACTVNWTADKGDTLVLTFTVQRSTSANTSTYVMYQTDAAIAYLSYNYNASTLSFGGSWPVTYTSNKLDVKLVVNFSTKTVALYVADVLGGEKRLVNTVPFITTNLTSQAARLYFNGPTAKVTAINAYNGEP